MSNENDTEQITVKKRSFIDILKTILGVIALTLVMNFFSVINVALNHAYNKGLGIATDVVNFCSNCLQAIGG